MTQLAERHTSLVTVHHLTGQNTPGALHDPYGQALRRLGLTARHTAQYLVGLPVVMEQERTLSGFREAA